ncbi:MAG TPA: FxLYD domain-containing protein [Gemmatimonadaceae bacterium]
MNLYRSLTALGGAVALAATGARAQQAKSCEIDESKPKEVATASFMLTQARGQQPQKRMETIRKVVKSLTEKGDALANPAGRNYQLGKAFYILVDDSTTASNLTRGDLGFTTNTTAPADVGFLADSVMRQVESAMPECKSLTSTWRRQQGWLRVTQKASNLFNAGQTDSASYYAQRSMLLDPQAPYAYSILASLAQKNNDIPKAIEYTRQAAEAAKSDTVFNEQRRLSLFNLGILLGSRAEAATGDEQKKLAQESVTAFRSFIAEAPATDENMTSARSSLARMLSVAGDTAGVKATYAAVLANPANYSEYELIQAGLAASRAGKDSDAISLFKVALNQNPYSRDALYNLSASGFNSGQFSTVLPSVKRLSEVDPNNPEVWRIMAGVYQGLNKAEKNTKIKAALTDTLLQAYNKYEKLPTVVTIKSFNKNPTSASLGGTIENRGTAAGSYALTVQFLDKAGNVVATQTTNVGPVAPKATADFKVDATGANIVAFRYQPLK